LRVTKRIGPFSNGIRPFTIDGRERLVYTATNELMGFQVGSIETGHVLYTAQFPGFSWDPQKLAWDCPSHGISLGPNERLLYVIDTPNDAVHAFDVADVPRSAPRMIATIKVSSFAQQESPCAYSCDKDGWLSQTHDGRYLFVGDSGDVIDTATRKVVKR